MRRIAGCGTQPGMARVQMKTEMPYLAPAAWRCTQVHHMVSPIQNGESLIDLQELECTARPPALFLCLTIVYVSLVLQGGLLL